ncbi:elongator complex protein 3 [Clostridium guangxiense]|uniref:elongator complex protein 3 n=1 Tax=Clostridium guangxiense TaxID=1662055 RepID=UPI001E3080B8|nr:radical SAM protein [Clostridium guangxiense]MCD2346000.1 radical SAM protein [Clostridium guangxiense]
MSNAHYIIPIFVPHEGCPHNCVFCNQNTITGVSDLVNANYVRSTIEGYIKTIPNKDAVIEVSFFGGTFTAIDMEKQKELLKVAKEYKDMGIVKYIHLSTRPDYIDDEILNNLKNYSADVIELGIQSLDKEVLLKSGRGHSDEDARKASKLIKEYGFILGHQVMLGLPGDSFEKDIETARKSIEMKPDICRIYPALVIKDTPMEKMYREGIYKPYTLEECIDICKVIYGMYAAHNIKIIRVGLQPTKEINKDGDVVAGPFHPAVRELVEGRIINDIIFEYLKDIDADEAEVVINEKDISKLYANKKEFFNDTKRKLIHVKINIAQSKDIPRNYIKIMCSGLAYNIDLVEYLKSKYKK